MSLPSDESTWPARGEIWTFALRGAAGTEMGGKIDDRGQADDRRRCVIVSRDSLRRRARLTVVPLQTHLLFKKNPKRDPVLLHNEIDESISSWAQRARWAASVRPYQRRVQEALNKKGEPYDYEFGARDRDSWVEGQWNPSVVDCGQLWTLPYAQAGAPPDSNHLEWTGPRAKLTDVALTNIETALHVLLSPWSRFPPENLRFQEGDVLRLNFFGTQRPWVVVSSPAIDYLRQNIWAHRSNPNKRRRFTNITVVPLLLNPAPHLRPNNNPSVPLVTLTDGTEAVAYCHEIYTFDWQVRTPKAMDLQLSPDSLVRVRHAIRIYLDLPTVHQGTAMGTQEDGTFQAPARS